jgi:hypothetical protein
VKGTDDYYPVTVTFSAGVSNGVTVKEYELRVKGFLGALAKATSDATSIESRSWEGDVNWIVAAIASDGVATESEPYLYNPTWVLEPTITQMTATKIAALDSYQVVATFEGGTPANAWRLEFVPAVGPSIDVGMSIIAGSVGGIRSTLANVSGNYRVVAIKFNNGVDLAGGATQTPSINWYLDFKEATPTPTTTAPKIVSVSLNPELTGVVVSTSVASAGGYALLQLPLSGDPYVIVGRSPLNAAAVTTLFGTTVGTTIKQQADGTTYTFAMQALTTDGQLTGERSLLSWVGKLAPTIDSIVTNANGGVDVKFSPPSNVTATTFGWALYSRKTGEIFGATKVGGSPSAAARVISTTSAVTVGTAYDYFVVNASTTDVQKGLRSATSEFTRRS